MPSIASEEPNFEEHTLMIRATRSRSIRPNKLKNPLCSPKRPRLDDFHRGDSRSMRILYLCKTVLFRSPKKSGSGPLFVSFWEPKIVRKPSRNGVRNACRIQLVFSTNCRRLPEAPNLEKPKQTQGKTKFLQSPAVFSRVEKASILDAIWEAKTS